MTDQTDQNDHIAQTAQIEQLVDKFERRRLTRRQLIGALAALIGIRAVAPEAATQSEPVMQATSLNHVTLAVSDVAQSQAFYERLLGVEEVTRQENGVNLGLGTSFLGLYAIPGPGRAHHCCIGIEDFDLEDVADKLRSEGLEPSFNRGVEVYFTDPDGTLVQLSSPAYRG